MFRSKEDARKILQDIKKSKNSFEKMQTESDRLLGASSLKETFDIVFGGANTFGELETENNEQIDFGYNFKKDI